MPLKHEKNNDDESSENVRSYENYINKNANKWKYTLMEYVLKLYEIVNATRIICSQVTPLEIQKIKHNWNMHLSNSEFYWNTCTQ